MKDKFQWKKPSKRTVLSILVLIIMIAVNYSISSRIFGGQAATETTYSEFLKQTEEQNISKVQVDSSQIYYTLKQDDQQESGSGILSGIQTFGSKGNCYYTIRMDDDMLVERLERSGAEFKQIKESENCLLSMAISVLFSFGLAPVNRSLAALICAAEYSRAVHPQPHPYS